MAISVPRRYVPRYLTTKDTKKQRKELIKSRKLYKKGKYYTRKIVPSFKSRKSGHILDAQRIYNIEKIYPSKELAQKTGCSIEALQKIVSKGEGAYFSSGSRPNQTAQSWGLARLASSITGGKASGVDLKILQEGCKKNSKALKLAKTAKYGRRRVMQVKL
jgi:hypothetical protein